MQSVAQQQGLNNPLLFEPILTQRITNSAFGVDILPGRLLRAVLLWMIPVGIAQGSGFAPRSVCGAGSDVMSVPQREGTGICELEFVILA